MKKIFLLYIGLTTVLHGYAQESKITNQQIVQTSIFLSSLHRTVEITDRIHSINNQIDSLRKDIHKEYLEYSKQQLYTSGKYQNDAFLKIKEESHSFQNRIKEIEHEIDSLNKENMSVDRIREYYEKNSIDSLYIHVDLSTLMTHKKMLSPEYPTIIDDLQILLESGDLLKKEYNEKRNSSKQQEMRSVKQCKTKEYLEGLLSVQKDISEEVDNWIKDEEHTLYSIIMFRTYLFNNYGVSLDADYPYLSDKVIKKVALPFKNK